MLALVSLGLLAMFWFSTSRNSARGACEALSILLTTSLPLFANADTISYNLTSYKQISSSPYQTFNSSDLRPPLMQINKVVENEITDGYIFMGVDEKPTSKQKIPCIYGMARMKL